MLRHPLRSTAALVLTVPLAVAAVAGPGEAAGNDPAFVLASTYEVSGEVAEILAVTPDGLTALYTDSEAQEVGVLDLRDPAGLRELGTVPVAGEPTSVVVTPDGRTAFVAVDTTEDLTAPSGLLVEVDVATRTARRSLALGGQPDSLALSDGLVVAAVENQRDEELVVGGVEGGLPQGPAGFLAVVDPALGTVDRVALTGLPGMLFPTDPEPEYVDVRDGVAAVTLQENNAVALVDVAARRVLSSFSAGTVDRPDADLTDDGAVSFTERLVAPREPDTVQWTAKGNLVTADEGDLAEEPSGGRGWTVFSPAGAVLSTSGSGLERALAGAGLYRDGRSDAKGAEPEGAEVARFPHGRDLAFIGAERADAVLVYDVRNERSPRLQQVLRTGSRPEGLVALPERGLFLSSNEGDGTVSVFQITGR